MGRARVNAIDYQILCVPPFRVDEIWPLARDYIWAGQRRCDVRFDEDAILHDLRSGALLLWIALCGHCVEAALITRLQRGESGLACHLLTLGGRDLVHVIPRLIIEIEQFARAEGCSKVTLSGRLGWRRVLSGSGYVQAGIILDKRIC